MTQAVQQPPTAAATPGTSAATIATTATTAAATATALPNASAETAASTIGATSTAATASATLNGGARLIVPFMDAVRDVFQKMAHLTITVEKPYLKTAASATYEVCGIIGFTGQITGTVVVSFSDAAADKLVNAFAGAELKREDPDFADAIGELANMIAGSAKQYLGGQANISVPSVVIGKGYIVSTMRSVPCVVVPCVSQFGRFALEVTIKRNPAA
jgi:chemotaxis protein CheX